jgi:hypothetical protein
MLAAPFRDGVVTSDWNSMSTTFQAKERFTRMNLNNIPSFFET